MKTNMKVALSVFIVLIFASISWAGFSGYLKADTAAIIKLGPFLDSTDGNTVESALNISPSEVRFSKNGGDFAQKNEGNNATYDEVGFYDCAVDATDTNTEGRLTAVVHESGALLVLQTYMVVAANIYDALYAVAGTDYLQVNTVQVASASQTANDNGADINAILTDTEAQDTSTELRTLLTGADVAVSTITTVHLDTACDTVTVTSIGANVITDAACAADIDTLINDEIADVLKTDTISELGAGAPVATPSIENAIMLIYMKERNKTETTASEYRITNDAGTVITESNISDDATTFIKGEFGAVD